MAAPSTLGPLAGRQFRLYYAGQASSLFGDEMVVVTITFAVLARYHTAGAVGTVLFAEALTLVLFLLWGGVLADRVSRRALLLAADLVRVATQTAAAIVLLTPHWQIWQLAAIFAVHGAATGVASPALIGLVADTTEIPQRQRANALLGMAASFASIGGPAVAGVVAAVGHGAFGVGVNAATYAVSAACLLAMAPTAAPTAASTGSTAHPTTGGAGTAGMLSDLRTGWHEFRSRTWLWVVVAQFSVFHLIVFPPIVVLGALVAGQHLGGSAVWGACLACLGVGSLLGGLTMLRWHPHTPMRVAVIATLPFAAVAALLAVPTSVWMIALAAGVAGYGFGLFGALWDTALTTQVPAAVLSRVSAYDWAGSVVLLPVGYAIVGPVADVIGVSATLWTAAATMAASVVVVLAVPAVRNLPSVGGPALADAAFEIESPRSIPSGR